MGRKNKLSCLGWLSGKKTSSNSQNGKKSGKEKSPDRNRRSHSDPVPGVATTTFESGIINASNSTPDLEHYQPQMKTTSASNSGVRRTQADMSDDSLQESSGKADAAVITPNDTGTEPMRSVTLNSSSRDPKTFEHGVEKPASADSHPSSESSSDAGQSSAEFKMPNINMREFEAKTLRPKSPFFDKDSENASNSAPCRFNDLTKTPNLTPAKKSPRCDTSAIDKAAEKTSKIDGRRTEGQRRANLKQALAPRAPSKSPHFELSMASYSKLIAYCGTGAQQLPRIATGAQQLPRIGGQSDSMVLPTNDDSSAVAAGSSGLVDDLCRLAKVLATLEECPWYWGALSGADAKNLLSGTELGTFLLRDSSDARHLFSLSVQTCRGPTSIRIVYSDGTFRFDSDMDDTSNVHRRPQQQRGMRDRVGHPDYVKKVAPIFTCVLRMLLHYTTHCTESRTNFAETKNNLCCPCSANNLNPGQDCPCSRKVRLSRPQFVCYWIDGSGRREVPILLSSPLSKKSFPSLQRLCRRTISVSLRLWDRADLADQLPLPSSLKKYVKRYPYPV